MFRHWIVLLVGLGLLRAACAQEGITRSIRVITDPSADICEVVESQLSCLARSPAEIQLKFRSTASAKRLHLVRIGYETQRILVSPTDSEARATLKPRPLLVESPPEGSPGGSEVRKFVNDRMRALFFGAQPPDGLSGFEFLGAVQLARIAPGKFEVIVPVMIEDRFRTKHLAAIDRNFPSDERPSRVGRALWNAYVGPLASALRDAFAAEYRIDTVTVAANYSRTRYTLVDDDSTFQFSTKAWVGSRKTGYGDVVQRVDEYRISTFRLPTGFQELAATKKMYVAVFVVPTAGPPTFEDVGLLSNDNRTGQLVAVKQR